MTPKRAAISIILVSLAFAMVMLLSSWLMADSEHRETVTFLLIAVWWIPYSFFCARLGSQCKKCN